MKKIDRIIVNYHHHYCSRRKIKFQASLHKDKSKSNLHPRSIYINLHANERKRCVLEHRVQLTNNSPRKRHNMLLSPLFSNSINHFLPTRYISKGRPRSLVDYPSRHRTIVQIIIPLLRALNEDVPPRLSLPPLSKTRFQRVEDGTQKM